MKFTKHAYIKVWQNYPETETQPTFDLAEFNQ